MNRRSSRIARQRRVGFLLLAGAVFSLAAGIGLVQYFDYPTIVVLGALPAVAILVFFAYRNLAASRAGVALGDERREQLLHDSGYDAFWILLSFIVIDIPLGITSERTVRTIYLIVGTTSFVVLLVYNRYVRESSP